MAKQLTQNSPQATETKPSPNKASLASPKQMRPMEQFVIEDLSYDAKEALSIMKPMFDEFDQDHDLILNSEEMATLYRDIMNSLEELEVLQRQTQ